MADISRYLLTDYYLADLVLKDCVSSRRAVLRRAQEAYERYLSLLDTYRMLSTQNKRLYERYTDSRDDFSLMSSNDASTRRDAKIARFKHEQELKLKLEVSIASRLQVSTLTSNLVHCQSSTGAPRRRCYPSRNILSRDRSLRSPCLPCSRSNSPRAKDNRAHALNSTSGSRTTRSRLP